MSSPVRDVELVTNLVTIFGEQKRAAEALGVSPPAVSAWLAGTAVSAQTRAAILQLLANWNVRQLWLLPYLVGLATGSAVPSKFTVGIERHTLRGREREWVDSESHAVLKKDRREFFLALIKRYLAYGLVVAGDFVVFYRAIDPGNTELVVIYTAKGNLHSPLGIYEDPLCGVSREARS